TSGDGDREGRTLPRKTFPLTLGGRTRDHRNALVRPPFLWSPNLIGGVKTWNQIAAPSGVARSTRAKVPRKASSRTSTHCTRKEKRVRPSSPARAERAGA